MLHLAMGNGCHHNHGDDYGEIGALATDGQITLTRADPSALGTRLAGNSSSVVPKLGAGLGGSLNNSRLFSSFEKHDHVTVV